MSLNTTFPITDRLEIQQEATQLRREYSKTQEQLALALCCDDFNQDDLSELEEQLASLSMIISLCEMWACNVADRPLPGPDFYCDDTFPTIY
jgi:hypothetical protein